MASGLCIAAWPWMPWMLLLLVVLFVIQYALIISLEEEYLRNNFGEIYRTYVQNVPRVLPKLIPYKSGQERFPSLQKALYSERSTLTSFIFVSLLIFLRWQLWG
jgi:hypothetical protein